MDVRTGPKARVYKAMAGNGVGGRRAILDLAGIAKTMGVKQVYR